ncbi:sugar ABC transporter permease [Ideonella sp. DXS22W]|uniref:Sugar ABC transporter permease n=1 Tax=Pseudaquabacterium inlustre TaxID=2984192 RepID=A0ABU9CRD3_9BURK
MTAPTARKPRLRTMAAWLALIPMAATVLVAYLGSTLWTLRMSVSGSRTFPQQDFVGLAQYERLFDNARWQHAADNLVLYGLLFTATVIALGTLLAIAIDQRVRAESLWRTVFLYPYALSFVATGLVWQWVLNPGDGLQRALQEAGWKSFSFDWITDPDRVIYCVVIAGVWQASGLVMALVLAGLRGIDEDQWKAARLDGIPAWRVYASIVLPQLTPTLATVGVLLSTTVIKLFDTVVAMTQGGPGTASDVPAKFIMDHLFGRANLALASAGAIVLLLTVLAIVAPLLYWRARGQRLAAGGHA